MPTILFFVLPIALSVYLHKKFKPMEGKTINKILINFSVSVFFLTLLLIVFEPHKETQNTEIVNVEPQLNRNATQTTKSNEAVYIRTPLELEGWVILYDELEQFKTDSVFLEYGFSPAGQLTQRQWLEKVQSHIMPPGVPSHYHAVPGNLRSLALSYVYKDTGRISNLRSELDKVLR